MKIVILDRDGVINYDSEQYIKSPDEMIPIPGSLEAITELNHAGYLVAVATNQSGVARGLFSVETLQLIHDKIYHMLEKLGGHIDLLEYCPHGPADGCECRKPAAGLLYRIAAKLNTKIMDVPVIGDSLRDLQAAKSADARPILVKTGNGRTTIASGDIPKGVKIYDDLRTAVVGILSEK